MTELISEADLDAMRRAIEWCQCHQRTQPHIQVLPSPMPPVGSSEWLAEAMRAVAIAQSIVLGLKHWTAPPCDSYDHIVVGVYARTAEEVGLRQRMRAAGISMFEPDVIRALEAAEVLRSSTTG